MGGVGLEVECRRERVLVRAEQNEIGGPVVLTLMILGMVVLLIWASC